MLKPQQNQFLTITCDICRRPCYHTHQSSISMWMRELVRSVLRCNAQTRIIQKWVSSWNDTLIQVKNHRYRVLQTFLTSSHTTWFHDTLLSEAKRAGGIRLPIVLENWLVFDADGRLRLSFVCDCVSALFLQQSKYMLKLIQHNVEEPMQLCLHKIRPKNTLEKHSWKYGPFAAPPPPHQLSDMTSVGRAVQCRERAKNTCYVSTKKRHPYCR